MVKKKVAKKKVVKKKVAKKKPVKKVTTKKTSKKIPKKTNKCFTKKNIKLVGLGILAIMLILFMAYTIIKQEITPSTGSSLDDFAKCLTEKGVAMYGAEWCSHCQNQKKEFGSSFQYVNFVDCDQDKQTCMDEQIKGYPTWKYNGQEYLGEQSFEKLSQISGCAY